MIRIFAVLLCLFLFMQVRIFAEGRPDIFNTSFTAGSGNYGQTAFKLSSDNNYQAGQFQINDRIEYTKSLNSGKAVLSQFNIFSLMLGIRYDSNSIICFSQSSHDKIKDTFSDIDYVAGFNHAYKFSQDTDIEAGIWCTNAVNYRIFKKIPFIFPMLSLSTRFKNLTLKLGMMNLLLWKGEKVQITFVYVPVWTSSVSFRYNFLPFLYTEIYSASNCYSVHSAKFEDNDRFNLLSCSAGLRFGMSPSRNINFSFGGGYVPYSREWIGNSTSGISGGRNPGRSYYGEVKAGLIF